MNVITAVTTAPGRGAIAVVEVTGGGAAAIVGRLFDRKLPAPGVPAFGRLSDNGPLDEVILRVIPPSDSFTGDETVEIGCHGGPAVVESVLDALERQGVKRVDPRGLLERARSNGRIDGLQEEAFALLPGALTERAARMLLDQAQGALSRAVREGRDMRTTAPYGIALADPRRIVLAGRPNAGKSTLFNALLARDRVLVSPVPGTTRDPVRELLAIDGVPFLLCDTAGVEEGRALDLLESLSVERARREIEAAHLVVFLHVAPDGIAPGEEEFLAHLRVPVLRVAAKADLGGRSLPFPSVSGKTGAGLDGLRAEILKTLGIVPFPAPGSAVVFTERQLRFFPVRSFPSG